MPGGIVGQDVDGFCAILRDAGHAVATKEIETPPPRLANLTDSAASQVLGVYHELGGKQEAPALRPGSWDVVVDGILVELDEQLHFNRYRALTLTVPSYEQLPRFPLAGYRAFCATKEQACLKAGAGQGRWMNDSTEAHFGPSGARGDFTGRGSSRWKQRALYDLMKDLTQLDVGARPLARIAIWDAIPGLSGVSVEQAVHRAPGKRTADGLRALIAERAGHAL
jgi:hypothetical protein